MTWGKLDDRLFLDDRIQRLLTMPRGHEAFTLYIAGITYAAGELTDGKVTPAGAACVAALAHVDLAAADCLESTGLWRKHGENWWINRFKKYNPSAAQVRQKRANTAARVSRWRESRASLGGNGVTPPSVTNGCNAAPVPSRPVPSRNDLNTTVISTTNPLQERPPPPPSDFINAVMAQWPVAGGAFYGRYLRLEEEYGADFMWDVWLTALDSGKPAPQVNYLEAIARNAVAEGRRPGERKEAKDEQPTDNRPTEIEGFPVIGWCAGLPIIDDSPKAKAT